MIVVVLVSILTSFAVCLVLTRYNWGNNLVRAEVVDPQHVHVLPVSRLGGVALGLAIVFAAFVSRWFVEEGSRMVGLVLFSAGPILMIGLMEDFSGRISARARYLASMVSALLVYFLADARLNRLDFPLLDQFLQWPGVVLLATVFCIASVAQAFNIVDGKNGLSSGLAVVALAGMGLAAQASNDQSLALLALTAAGAALGFFLVNFPRGLIFLGDGGAYCIGFLVATVAVLSVVRHPELSAWFPPLCAAYPIMETLTSFGRRLLIEKRGFHEPDHLHLHSLLYRNIYVMLRRRWRMPLWLVNAVTSVPIVLAGFFVVCVAFHFRFDTGTLQFISVGVILSYLATYVMLRRIRSGLLAHSYQ